MAIDNSIQTLNSAGVLQEVGINLLKQVNDLQSTQVGNMLQDFKQNQAPHPTLGNKLDISI